MPYALCPVPYAQLPITHYLLPISQFPEFPNSAKLRLGLVHLFHYLSFGMEVGQKVKVVRLRDRLSSGITSKMFGKIGTIKDFKITDGKGLGYVVKFDDNSATWFFEDELKLVQ